MEHEKLGVFKPATMAKKIMEFYEKGPPPCFSTGFDNLDQYFKVRPGEVTVVTGTPNAGKSSFLDQLLVNLSVRHGWVHGMFTPENQPYELHVANLLEKLQNKPFRTGPTERMTAEEVKEGIKLLGMYFRYVHPERFTLYNILEGFGFCAYMGCKTAVLDPWARADRERARNQSETEYINQFLTDCSDMARRKGIHLFIVAHPKIQVKDKDGQFGVVTPYDISGSAHWFNLSDNILSVWRDFQTPGRTVVHVKKVRFKDVGTVTPEHGCEFEYDRVTGIYKEVSV